MTQHVTFHLADSLPDNATARMQRELESFSGEQQGLQRRERIQELLDNGHGSCVLGHDGCAKLVEEALLFGDGERYRLFAWVVMPNHIHVLIEQREGWPLSKVVQSWKRHTARRIHLLGSTSCTQPCPDPLWQRDYWDRFIRDEAHFEMAKRYIEENPVKAGLCETAGAWSWGSARLAEEPSATRRSREE